MVMKVGSEASKCEKLVDQCPMSGFNPGYSGIERAGKVVIP